MELKDLYRHGLETPVVRDDSAGEYTTSHEGLSWDDWVRSKSSDTKNALANLGRNLVDGFSPIGTSEQGNMALQVPPVISGIADSYSRLAGTPNNPGNAYNLSGVPELDAPIQQDMSNVLLSLYGGNAVAGLTKPKGALGAGAMREEAAAPVRAYRGATNAGNIARDDAPFLWASSSPDVAATYARPHFNNNDIAGAVAPLDVDFNNPMTVDAKGGSWVGLDYGGQKYTADDLAILARDQGHDGLVIRNVLDAKNWWPGDDRLPPADNYVALQRGTVKSPLTGETLFSDTGKPSILGSAMAGDQNNGRDEINAADQREIVQGQVGTQSGRAYPEWGDEQHPDAPWYLPRNLIGDTAYRYQGVVGHGLAALASPLLGPFGIPNAIGNGGYAAYSLLSGRTNKRPTPEYPKLEWADTSSPLGSALATGGEEISSRWTDDPAGNGAVTQPPPNGERISGKAVSADRLNPLSALYDLLY